MKIALVGKYGEGDIIGGPERVARELYGQYKKNDLDVTFIEYFFTGYSDYTFIKKIFGKKKKEDNVLRLGIFPLLFKLFKQQFKIIHFVNSQRFTLIFFFLKPFLKAKFVSTLHGLFRFEIPQNHRKRLFLDLYTEKFLIRKSDVVIFPSKLLLKAFANEYNLKKQNLNVIPNGIGKEFIHKNIIPKYDKEISMIFYNAFEESVNKGLEKLVDELSVIDKIRIKVVVIGREDKIYNKNPNLKIIFIGNINHESLINLLNEVQFVVKSNAFEPFSIFVAECMCVGIIPIISENTGIKDFIENGVNGFIYESSGANNLEKILNGIQSKKYNLNIISNNTRKIYDELNWIKISEQYISLYRSIV